MTKSVLGINWFSNLCLTCPDLAWLGTNDCQCYGVACVNVIYQDRNSLTGHDNLVGDRFIA